MHPELKTRSNASQRGYVLIFVLGVLFVLSVMVLEVSTSIRTDASATSAAKQTLQSEFLLKGALQRVVWGLETGEFVNDLEVASRPRNPSGQPLDISDFLGRPLGVRFEDHVFKVHIDNGGVLVDPNRLTPEMWRRLIAGLGFDATVAGQVAQNIEVARKAGLATGSGELFRRLQDVSQVTGLTHDAFYGDDLLRNPGVIDYLVPGKSDNRLDINYSPPLLYKVVFNASDQQVSKLLEGRAKGLLTDQDEQRIFGSTVPAASKPEAGGLSQLRIRIGFGDSLRTTGMTMLSFVEVSQSKAVITASMIFYR